MVTNFHLPPQGFGPGSQGTGEEVDYMAMPSGMRTYSPHIPDIDDPSAAAPALDLLAQVADACTATAADGRAREFDLSGLSPNNRALIAETMGHGEVAMKIRGIPAIAVQESVFAGVWVQAGAGVDKIEIAAVPALAIARANLPHRPALGHAAQKNDGVFNAPALLVELLDKSANWHPAAGVHTVNLSLLPHTEEDLVWLETALGEGAVTCLSRGYGNCRVTASATPHVWRVQFYNSTDALILDTWEVSEIPEVVAAAREDLADSADRIREVIEAIR